jgi:uncharacterized DUF497 family protein
MTDDVSDFDWDVGNRLKCQKHGVTIAEIEALFVGARVAPDVSHSAAEDRYIAIGRNAQGRAIFVGFTFRVRERRRLIRPITARYMHGKEIDGYEAKSPQDDL